MGVSLTSSWIHLCAENNKEVSFYSSVTMSSNLQCRPHVEIWGTRRRAKVHIDLQMQHWIYEETSMSMFGTHPFFDHDLYHSRYCCMSQVSLMQTLCSLRWTMTEQVIKVDIVKAVLIVFIFLKKNGIEWSMAAEGKHECEAKLQNKNTAVIALHQSIYSHIPHWTTRWCNLQFCWLHVLPNFESYPQSPVYVKYLNVPSEIARNMQYLLYWLHSEGYFIKLYLPTNMIFLPLGELRMCISKVHTGTHFFLPDHIDMHIESKVDNVNQKVTARRKVANPDIHAPNIVQ